VIDVSKRFSNQCGHMGVEEPVHHVTPLAIADDKSEVPQDAQLMRDGGLLHLDLATEFAD
jgi:hypothetical protein